MSISQALNAAISGLRVTQAGMSVVAANVANAETPGYVRKSARQVTTAAGELGIGVRVGSINRELDQYVQRQLRIETSGAAYAGLRAQFYGRLQTVYGQPGSDIALETVFNDFTERLQALTTSPDSGLARSDVITSAQLLTQRMNAMSSSIQGLRADAELGLSDSVARANEALHGIADLNQKLIGNGADTSTGAVLQDQRDKYIAELTQLMDINVIEGDNRQISVFTNSGVQLVGMQAVTLQFDARPNLSPNSQWSPDASDRTLGTISIAGQNGTSFDLVTNKSIRSGEIAAYLEMRDSTLVEAQSQLDEMASAMARALSDRTVTGTSLPPGPPDGIAIDTAGMSPGNRIQVTYTDNLTGQTHRLSLVHVTDPSALPLPNTATADPGDRVIGLDLSGPMASIAAQLNGALGATGLQFSPGAGTQLRVLDDGASGRVDVNAVTAGITESSLTSGRDELPFFLDNGKLFTGAITGGGPQSLGLAARINVNQQLADDPSRLVVKQTAPPTPASDQARATFLVDRLTKMSFDYAPGKGTAPAAPATSGTISSFMRQFISQQGQNAESASSLSEGQDVVLNSLEQRFAEASSVNIDEEMANLLNLQNAYAANARVMTTVKEMVDLLMRM